MSSGAVDLRDAVAAARLGVPGGPERLDRALAARAERYAGFVLALPPDRADAVARAAVARTSKHLSRRADPDDLGAALDLAVRTEAFRRQPGVATAARTRALAVAALVLVAVGFGAVALVLVGGGSDAGPDAPPMSVSAAHPDAPDLTLDGLVVGPDGPDGVADVAVEVRRHGAPVAVARTDDHGRFRLRGLDATTYEVRVSAPDGLVLADGTSSIDLTDRDLDAVVLRLEAD